MKRLIVLRIVALSFLLCLNIPVFSHAAGPTLYHGVFPGGFTGDEDDITLEQVKSYEAAVGKKAAWVYFSNNWYSDRTFPAETAEWIRDHGSVPFIRLMLMDSWKKKQPNKIFTLEKIIQGDFDKDLSAWAKAAKAFGSPLLVEYGVEVNGYWFPWNGKWNGGPGQGPKRFVQAYRHIVDVMRKEKADNIRWVFHVDVEDNPEEDWNRFENYFPGQDYVDWLGVSVYGAATPLDDEWPSFRERLDKSAARLAALAKGKPVVILEFGVTNHHPKVNQAKWADAALKDLTEGRWPGITGFSWWNETWRNDDDRSHDTDMRVQSNPALVGVFKKWIGRNSKVSGSLVLK